MNGFRTSQPVRATVGALAAFALVAGSALVVLAAPAGAVDVGNETDFTAAWENDATTEILLAADITLTCDSGTPFRDSDTAIVVEGAGHTIQQTCVDSAVLASHGDGAVTLRDVTITGGHAAGIASAGGGVFSDGALTVERSTVSGNVADGSGGGLVANGAITIVASTISGNEAGGNGGGVSSSNQANPITIVNSTITGNSVTTEGIGGGGVSASDLTLVYSTVVGNSADVGANVFIHQASFIFRSAFGSVVADPQGGGENCGYQGASEVTSNGGNFSDDSSCEFTNAAAGDRQDAGSPLLGALGANGGPTATMLPQDGSPLLDAIAATACQDDGAAGVTTDQRGVTRPQGTGCDTGAVEVTAPIVDLAPTPVPAPPRFTG